MPGFTDNKRLKSLSEHQQRIYLRKVPARFIHLTILNLKIFEILGLLILNYVKLRLLL